MSGWRWLAAGLGLALIVIRPRRAMANGTPVRINLRYLSGISNYGPTNAIGVVEIVLIEGDVRVDLRGLPKLNGELYQAWLVNSASGDRLSIGKFNAGEDGSAYLESVLDLTDQHFDLAVISIEPEPDPSPNPDARLSIAGFFPGAQPVTPTPEAVAPPTPEAETTGTPGPTPTALPLRPVRLPRTGGGPAIEVRRSMWCRVIRWLGRKQR
ncbi:MAG: hypothetical protein HYY04_05005 [Chloroflexi bacterium]|nr:hypothetical protein [Chloroflexota bacterium]